MTDIVGMNNVALEVDRFSRRVDRSKPRGIVFLAFLRIRMRISWTSGAPAVREKACSASRRRGAVALRDAPEEITLLRSALMPTTHAHPNTRGAPRSLLLQVIVTKGRSGVLESQALRLKLVEVVMVCFRFSKSQGRVRSRCQSSRVLLGHSHMIPSLGPEPFDLLESFTFRLG